MRASNNTVNYFLNDNNEKDGPYISFHEINIFSELDFIKITKKQINGKDGIRMGICGLKHIMKTGLYTVRTLDTMIIK